MDIKQMSGLVVAIDSGGEAVRLAAVALTERIVVFEKWLSSLRGKVDTYHELGHDESGIVSENLVFTRDGKDWSLFLQDYDASHEEPGARRLLRDASVEDKVRAIRTFPAFLANMRQAQDSRVKMATEAAKAFDEFALSLGIPAILQRKEMEQELRRREADLRAREQELDQARRAAEEHVRAVQAATRLSPTLRKEGK